MSSKENPLKGLKITQRGQGNHSFSLSWAVHHICAQFLLFFGQVVWMLHPLQLSSSSWWSIEWLCLLGRCPRAACLGSSLWLHEPLQVCCVPEHTQHKYSYSSPLESQNSLFPPPPPFCWHRNHIAGLDMWLVPRDGSWGNCPGVFPHLAVLKHILPRTFSCKTANARSLG